MPKVTSELSMWFDYPDDEYNGRVHVRYLKGGELAAIRERTTEAQAQYIQEFRQKDVSIRQNGTKEAICIAAIKDWENFYNLNDEPLACTPGNIKIMCLEAGFYEFIDQCLSILEDDFKAKQEAERKN